VPSVVLDTNVVLDWLVFGDASATPLVSAIQGRRLRWLSCPRMRAELASVLQYPALASLNSDSEHTLTQFDRWAVACLNPAPLAINPACTDADDQVFIDLALAQGADWLVTRDRALLKLARRMLARGVRIVTPTRWSALEAQGAAEAAPC
jgi:putative PIN family toxin of toxin-antitoxin system